MQTKKTVMTEERTGIRRFMTGTTGIVVAVVALGVGALMIARMFGGGELADTATRNFICAETGKSFSYTLKAGETLPVMSPYSKQPTGYLAEKCYWTRDGKAKAEPTLVLLNIYVGKSGPTICPDCGREVVPHNPLPPWDLMREATEAAKQAKGK